MDTFGLHKNIIVSFLQVNKEVVSIWKSTSTTNYI